jgi:hypothetical protein
MCLMGNPQVVCKGEQRRGREVVDIVQSIILSCFIVCECVLDKLASGGAVYC